MTISDIIGNYQLTSDRYHPLHTNHPPITEQSIRCQIVTPKRKKPSNGTRSLQDMPQRTRDQPELHYMPGIQSQPITIADLAFASTAVCIGIDRTAFISSRRCGRRYLQEIISQSADLAGILGGRSDGSCQKALKGTQPLMSSNEHPDMHGNPADAPILCDNCGNPCHEDNLFGSHCNDEPTFCSQDCVDAYEQSQQFDHDL
jgi:hypothetical protein